MEEHTITALMDSVRDYVRQETYGRTANAELAENIATRVRDRMDKQARPLMQVAKDRVEIVVGYDADGGDHNRVIVNGEYASPAWYDIDPDSKLCRRDPDAWKAKWEDWIVGASPLAAQVVLEWVNDTATRGNISLGDDEDE